MNLQILAAEIARRIPEMARDSVVNNEATLLRMLKPQFHQGDHCPACGNEGRRVAHWFECKTDGCRVWDFVASK